MYTQPKAEFQTNDVEPICESANIIRFDIEPNGDPCPDAETRFFRAMEMSRKEADYFGRGQLDHYDVVMILHMFHSFGLVEEGIAPLEKTVLFPMSLSDYYQKYMHVPEEFIDREAAVLKRVMHNQLVSTEEAMMLSKKGVPGNQFFVVPRGYDTSVFPYMQRESIPGKEVHIYCANRISSMKGQHHFIQIVLECMRQGLYPVVHLAGIFGSKGIEDYNAYALRIKDDINRLGLQCNFVFHGALSQAELADLGRRCHVAIFPSVTESFGKSVLEAAGMGLPTVVFDDVICFSDFMVSGDNGLILPRDPSYVAQTLKNLVEDAGFYKAISANCRSIPQSYSISSVMDRTLGVYRQRGIL